MRIASELNPNFDHEIEAACNRVLLRQIRDRAREAERMTKTMELLKAVNEVVPLERVWDHDLISEVYLNVNEDNVANVLGALRESGYSFADATYSHSHTDDNGQEYVQVMRICNEVTEPDACPYANGHLHLSWVAKYDPSGPCKIQESTNVSTYKSLVCETK